MRIIALSLVLFICGCKTSTITPLSSAKIVKFAPEKIIFITTPADGDYGSEHYEGSGKNVANAFEAAFLPHTANVVVGGRSESVNDALEAAKTKKSQYLVLPRITHWEDRATEWSGIPDRIEVFIQLYSVEDGAEITSAKINGKSSWFTFGGDHPQDLLKEPTGKFVNSLY